MNNEEVSRATKDAEDCLIGAILVESTRGDRTAINGVARFIEPSHFKYTINRRIYSAMLSCPLPPHQINVANELFTRNILEPDDCSFLAYLVSLVPCSLDYIDYAKSVLQFSQVRQGVPVLRIKGVIL